MPRKMYSPEFKAQLALTVLSGKKTVTELSEELSVHKTLICKWVKEIKKSAAFIFSGERCQEVSMEVKGAQRANTKIEQLTKEERDFLTHSFGNR